MGRLGIHATGAAAGAELTDLAGEGEELLAAAVGAVDAGEAVRRISAARKGGLLPLHEGRVVPATLLAGGPEGRSVALEDLVQDGTAWIATKGRAAGSLGLEFACGDHASEVARCPGVFRDFLRALGDLYAACDLLSGPSLLISEKPLIHMHGTDCSWSKLANQVQVVARRQALSGTEATESSVIAHREP
jgi:hypothetical protein